MSRSYNREVKHALTARALANGGTIRVATGSVDWRFLETMVDNGEFERVERTGQHVLYRLVTREVSATSNKQT
jgi:hypothetical protein